MNLKLIIALVADDKTEAVVRAARQAGATGSTVIPGARGEGLKKEATFFGLELTLPRDVVLLLVAEPKAREILETIAATARLDEDAGAGIAFQIAIEDAVGLRSQAAVLLKEIEDSL